MLPVADFFKRSNQNIAGLDVTRVACNRSLHLQELQKLTSSYKFWVKIVDQHAYAISLAGTIYRLFEPLDWFYLAFEVDLRQLDFHSFLNFSLDDSTGHHTALPFDLEAVIYKVHER